MTKLAVNAAQVSSQQPKANSAKGRETNGTDFMDMMKNVGNLTSDKTKDTVKTKESQKTERKDDSRQSDDDRVRKADEKDSSADESREVKDDDGKVSGKEARATDKKEAGKTSDKTKSGLADQELAAIASMVTQAAPEITEGAEETLTVEVKTLTKEAAVQLVQAEGQAETLVDPKAVAAEAVKTPELAAEAPEAKATDEEDTVEITQPIQEEAAEEPLQAVQTEKAQNQSDAKGQNADGQEEQNLSAAQAVAAGTSRPQQAQGIEKAAETFDEHMETQTLETTEADLSEDVAKVLSNNFPKDSGTLELELEPRTLGRITISVTYNSGKASVAIAASNPRTLDLLTRNVDTMAGILKEATGEDTTVVVPNTREASAEAGQRNADSESANKQSAEEQREHHQDNNRRDVQDQSESFLGKMRLGLI